MAVLKTDVAEMKGDIVSMKGDIHGLKEGLHYQGILAEDTNRKIDIMLEILTATTKKFEKIDPLEGKVDGLQDDHAILKGVVKSHIADKDLHSR